MAEEDTTACKAAKTAVTAAEGILKTATADKIAASLAAGLEFGLNPVANAWLTVATTALTVATTALAADKTAETAACS